MTLKEIKEKMVEWQRLLIDIAPLETEYYRKITWSFSSLIFILLGFPLAVITHRREKSANMVLAIMCAGIYYLLSLGCEALSIQHITPAMMTMWVPNILAGTIALFLNLKLCVS